jgi:hypothetical protein
VDFPPPPTCANHAFRRRGSWACAWLGLLALVGIVFALGVNGPTLQSVLISLVALGLADSVFFRLGATIHDLDAQAGVMIREPAAPSRAARR